MSKLLRQGGQIAKLPKLVGDERRLKQVLINLVKNSLKFTNRGSIQVKASYDATLQVLIIHVEDTGVGISAADLPLLFSRFGKLHRTAELNNEGIGLGLTIVKQIVEASGGSIIAESGGPNCGSCFIFSMQMRPALETDVDCKGEILDDNWES